LVNSAANLIFKVKKKPMTWAIGKTFALTIKKGSISRYKVGGASKKSKKLPVTSSNLCPFYRIS
jgi:hypothetical protein